MDTKLDVRTIPLQQRHPRIFETLDSLKPGDAMIIVNDHDPKPLYYQIQAERTGSFGWEYIEQGPDTWQVKVSRT